MNRPVGLVGLTQAYHQAYSPVHLTFIGIVKEINHLNHGLVGLKDYGSKLSEIIYSVSSASSPKIRDSDNYTRNI
jgi:hypothetical protein